MTPESATLLAWVLFPGPVHLTSSIGRAFCRNPPPSFDSVDRKKSDFHDLMDTVIGRSIAEFGLVPDMSPI